MSYFKLAKNIVWGHLEITCKITPELYDIKCNYQLILSITKMQETLHWKMSYTIQLLSGKKSCTPDMRSEWYL